MRTSRLVNNRFMQENGPFLIAEPRVWIERADLSAVAKLVADGACVLVLRSGDGVPGGTGKTTLAHKLAHSLRETYSGPHIELDVGGGVGEVAARQRAVLGACARQVESKATDDVVQLAYGALFAQQKRGVLLLDDVCAEDDGRLQKLLPPKDAQWLTIVTTRVDLSELASFATLHRVGQLSTAGGLELLRKHAYGANSERQEAADDETVLAEIVEACGCIALAVKLAGCQLRLRAWSASKLRDKLRSKGAHTQLNNSGERGVAASLSVTYAALSLAERRALWQAAAFPSQFSSAEFERAVCADIRLHSMATAVAESATRRRLKQVTTAPLRFARRLFGSASSQAVTAETKPDPDDGSDGSARSDDDSSSSSEAACDLLDQLRHCSLLQWTTGSQRYSVHSVVRQFALDMAKQENARDECLLRAGLAFAQLVCDIEKQYDAGQQEEAMWRLRQDVVDRFGLFVDIGGAVRCALGEAVGFCCSIACGVDDLSRLFQKLLSERSSRAACWKHNLAQVLIRKGEYAKAVGLLTDALRARTKALGADDLRTLASKHSLAVLLAASENTQEKAAGMFREVLRARERILGAEHELTLETKLCLAIGLQNSGALDAAVASFHEILSVCEHAQGAPTQLARVMAQFNLAIALDDQGEHKRAQAMLEEVVEVAERVLGDGYAETHLAKESLAGVLSAQGEYGQAIDLLDSVRAVQAEALGEEHPTALRTSLSLAQTLASVGECVKAVALLAQVLSVQERVLGAQHETVRRTKTQLALVLEQQGEWRKALDLCNDVLHLCNSTLGPRHPETLDAKVGLASVLHMRGEYDRALRMAKDVLALYKRFGAAKVGPFIGLVFDAQHCVAGILCDTGQFKDAIALYSEIVAEEKKTCDDGVCFSELDLASVLAETGQDDKAVEMFERIVAAMEKAFGDHHYDTVRTEETLAATLCVQGKHERAKGLYERLLAKDGNAVAMLRAELESGYAHVLHLIGTELDRAVDMLRTLVPIVEAKMGPNHRYTLSRKRFLAEALRDRNLGNDCEEAGALFEVVLDAVSQQQAPNHEAVRDSPLTSKTKYEYALLLKKTGKVDQAALLLRDAVDANTRRWGVDHPDTRSAADALKNLDAKK